jgi:hypothetical protein
VGWAPAGPDLDELPSYFGELDRPPRERRSRPPRAPRPEPGIAAPAPPSRSNPARWVDRQFIRVVDVPLATSVASLERLTPSRGWRRARRGGARFEVRSRGDAGGGPVVVGVELHRRFARTLSMELELGPWLLAGTRIDLRPRHPVRATRRYFRVGHAFLDQVVTGLRPAPATAARWVP